MIYDSACLSDWLTGCVALEPAIAVLLASGLTRLQYVTLSLCLSLAGRCSTFGCQSLVQLEFIYLIIGSAGAFKRFILIASGFVVFIRRNFRFFSSYCLRWHYFGLLLWLYTFVKTHMNFILISAVRLNLFNASGKLINVSTISKADSIELFY